MLTQTLALVDKAMSPESTLITQGLLVSSTTKNTAEIEFLYAIAKSGF